MGQLASFRAFVEGDADSRVNADSKVLSIGISDGARLSLLANLYNAESPYVHTGVGFAGTAQNDYDVEPACLSSDPPSCTPGLIGENNGRAMETSGIRYHAYWTDDDMYYESASVPAIAARLGLGSPTTTTTTHHIYSFTKDAWSGDCCADGSNCQTRVTFEVHDATTSPNFGGGHRRRGAHSNFCVAIDTFDSVITESLDRFIVDLGFTGCPEDEEEEEEEEDSHPHKPTHKGLIAEDLWLTKIKEEAARKAAEEETKKKVKMVAKPVFVTEAFSPVEANKIKLAWRAKAVANASSAYFLMKDEEEKKEGKEGERKK